MKFVPGAITAFFTNLRLVLRDVVFQIGVERRQRRLAELEDLLGWAYTHGFSLEQTIVLARNLGYRRQARMLEELRDARTPRLRLHGPRE